MRSIVLLSIGFLFSFTLFAQITLPKVFGDHMVLQRGQDIPVWGFAPAGTNVQVQFNQASANTKADENGTWIVHLPPMNAGGPYVMTISAPTHPDTAITFSDVLIGDVWFASGQSNMEWQVQQSNDAQKECKDANYPQIRFFGVNHAKSVTPQTDVKGTWQACDSNRVKTASAVAYFFARKIHQDINIPVGILQSTWGGTPVQAWISRDMLLSLPLTQQQVLDNDTITLAHFVKDSLNLALFWDIVYHPKNNMHKIIPAIDYNDSKWDIILMPKTFKDWGWPFYEGMVWFRKKVKLTKEFTGNDITLHLGQPEMNYSLYFNGHEICKTVWNANPSHTYTIPARFIRKGENVVTVRTAVLWGGGGFNPPAESMYLSNGNAKITLAGDWTYKKDLEPAIPKIFNYHYYPSYLYNAMIHPVVPFGIKGFIWYQGEANDFEAYQYRTMFPMMITDWRIRWKQGYLPFLFVQLPNYMKRQHEPTESQWAEMREAQMLTLSQPNTGMVCAIDLGDANTIHPLNKQEVGRRLAMVAEQKVYNQNVCASGPMFQSFQIIGNTVRIRFTQIGSGLTTRNFESLKGFAIAGEDKKFFWATARIEGNEVVVSTDQVPSPVALRYAWADNPDCNLINKEGLPAIPFRTDSWKGLTQK